ncbi:MAG: response regulator transcription factor [Flavobacteriales bacterium]|nr:response regulator transcription factor [Flavobacteriales bacterium]
MKAIILEDESRAAKRLQRLIEEIDNEIQILEVLESVRGALGYFQNNTNLDVIFADIQLADGLSFELFEQIKPDCPVIFTTAYDQYAIKAFKNNGIDYLLKPIDEEELEKAIAKLKAMTQVPKLADLMALAAQLNTGKKVSRSRFMVKIGSKLRSITIEEVAMFYSENKGTYIQTKEGRNYLIDSALEKLEDEVDDSLFFRISRKYMVNIDSVEEMVLWSNSRLKLKIQGSTDEEIVVARERTKDFKSWMDG